MTIVSFLKGREQVSHATPLHPQVTLFLWLQVIYSKLNYQSSYYSISYGAIDMKIHHDKEHQIIR